MSDLKYILKIKRKLKGEEAGRAVLKDLAYSNSPLIRGTGKQRQLFTMGEKAFIQDNILNDPAEIRTYNRYVHLCNTIMETSKTNEIYRFRTLYAITNLNLTMVRIAEDCILRNDSPYIMTEQEYEEVRKRHLDESLKDEDGNYYYYNIYTILGRAFRYYKWETPDKDPKYEHIYAVMRKYDEEPCKDEYLISQYNRVNKVGHYTKPDGTIVKKQDMMSKVMRELLEKEDKKEGIDTDKISDEEVANNFFVGRAKIEQVKDELDKLEDTFTLDTETEPFTLYNILEDVDLYYPNLHEDTKEGDKERKHFMETFKELIDEVVKQIDTDFFNGDIAKWLKKGGDLLDVVYRADDLLNKGFPHILIDTEAELMGWNEPYKYQVEEAGIAVLKCSGKNNSVKFKTAKTMNNPLCMLSRLLLNGIESKTDEFIQVVEEGIYFLQGYNKGLELLAEYTGVKELTDLQVPIQRDNIDAYNNAYYMALHQLDGEDRKKLKEKYRHIRTDFKIPEERINKARSLLVGLEAFKDRAGNYEFFDTLTTFVPEEHQ